MGVEVVKLLTLKAFYLARRILCLTSDTFLDRVVSQ